MIVSLVLFEFWYIEWLLHFPNTFFTLQSIHRSPGSSACYALIQFTGMLRWFVCCWYLPYMLVLSNSHCSNAYCPSCKTLVSYPLFYMTLCGMCFVVYGLAIGCMVQVDVWPLVLVSCSTCVYRLHSPCVDCDTSLVMIMWYEDQQHVSPSGVIILVHTYALQNSICVNLLIFCGHFTNTLSLFIMYFFIVCVFVFCFFLCVCTYVSVFTLFFTYVCMYISIPLLLLLPYSS
jgi:hypothetical protein